MNVSRVSTTEFEVEISCQEIDEAKISLHGLKNCKCEQLFIGTMG
jgi:hypothetical protein